MSSDLFPSVDVDFEALRDVVAARVDLDARLPDWPFRGVRGHAVIFEYDRILGGSFGDVLAALVDAYGDDTVTALGVEPPLFYYRDEYGLFPAFRIAGERVRIDYGDALRFEPGGDPTGSLGDSLDVIAISGSSGAWSVFGQRDWEIGLLRTVEPNGVWLDAGVPWFDVDVDLNAIRSPAGWGVALSESDREEFVRQCRVHRPDGTTGRSPS